MNDLAQIKAILGLGNPTSKQNDTFHNAGLAIINLLTVGCSFKDRSHFSYCRLLTSDHRELIAAKSLVYMNNSGLAFAELASFFKLSPEQILVIHDDADQNLGRSKLTIRGRSGGHHGIDSIISVLGTNSFPRFKVGIRKPEHNQPIRQPSKNFVLKKMSAADQAQLYFVASSLIKKLKLKDTLPDT